MVLSLLAPAAKSNRSRAARRFARTHARATREPFEGPSAQTGVLSARACWLRRCNPGQVGAPAAPPWPTLP
eukprot:12288583-Alexandrium_andersonii.AAC.1